MASANVYDIYMDSNIGATGTKRHFTNQLKYYSRPIIATNAENYIDEGSEYTNISSISLHTSLYKIRGRLETAVCVCIYNEDREAIEQTLKGVYKNLRNLPPPKNYKDETGHEHPKEQIAVFIIQDGIMKCHDSVKEFLRPYEPTPYKSKLTARQQIIQYETLAVKNKKRQFNPTGGDDFPWSVPRKTSLMYEIEWKPEEEQIERSLKVFFVFKHLNGKKLSSHAWFFEGFCRYLTPEFCVLLDVGTVPHEYGVANFIKVLKNNQDVGGVSGFMNIDASLASEGVASTTIPANRQLVSQTHHAIELNNQQLQDNTQSCWKRWFWSIEKAQACEYIMAHFLDKNFESSLGFLHVLPGAWSAYRLCAMQTGEIFEQDILQKKYFRTIINPDEKLEAQEMMKTSNMYLAEDRILSLAIYCQRNKKYSLQYVPDARAYTDPMKTQADLSLQRRRWINSSLYAFEYVQANYECDMANSNHSGLDKALMHFNIFMSSVSFFNASLIPCFFLFVLFSTIRYNGLIPVVQKDLIRQLLAYLISIPYVIVVIVAIGGSMIGNIWINDIYERDERGDVIMERVPGKRQLQPKKRDGKKPKTNGNAAYITAILTVYNYIWFVAVGTFTLILVYNGITKYGLNFSKMNNSEAISILFLFVNLGCSFLLIFVHLFSHPKQVWELIIGFPSSLAFLSLYTHTMVIFSVCNVDDTSWGTKGSTDKQGTSDFSKEKSYFVGWWILKNAVMCFLFFMIDMYATQERWITIIIACYSSTYYALKCIFAIGNQIAFLFRRCCCKLR